MASSYLTLWQTGSSTTIGGTLVKRTAFGLAIILLLAATLRLWGLDYGLPHPLSRPDEERIVGRAQTIFATGDWHPGSFYYPSLLFYLDTAALEVYYGVQKMRGRYARPFDFLFDIAVTHPGLHYLIGRWVGALAGSLTVLVVFFLGTAVSRSRTVGLVAALFLAVCHLHVRESHFATVDVVMTLFVTVSLLFAVRASSRPTIFNYVFAGFFAGLAASTKYNAGIVVLSLLAASHFAHRESKLDERGVFARLAVAALVAAGAFAVTSPYVLLRYEGFLSNMSGLSAFLYERQGGLALWGHLKTTLPAGLGWPLFLASVAGLARALWLRRPGDVVLLAFAIPYFVLVSGVRVTFPRYVVPIVPVLVILAGLAVDLVHQAASRYRAAALTAATLVLATPTLVSSVRYDRVASEKDTRVLAADWIAANVAPQSRILVCRGYGAPHVNEDRRRPPAFVVREIDCDTPDDADAYLVTHEHEQLTRFSNLSPVFSSWLDANASLRAVFDPYRKGSETEPVFYRADAFYIPIAGYDAVVRGGPIVKIWRLPQSARSSERHGAAAPR